MMSNKDGNWMSKLLIKAHMELWTLEWSKGTSFSGDVGAEGGVTTIRSSVLLKDTLATRRDLRQDLVEHLNRLLKNRMALLC